FISLFFDDMHLAMEDAVSVRTAGARILDAMAPTDRVGIYSSSGQVKQEFTGDRERLKQTLVQITARPLNATGFHDCPEVTYYQADLIENRSENQALSVATEEAVQCAFGGDESKVGQAAAMARAAAARVLASGDSATDYCYAHIYDALRTL